MDLPETGKQDQFRTWPHRLPGLQVLCRVIVPPIFERRYKILTAVHLAGKEANRLSFHALRGNQECHSAPSFPEHFEGQEQGIEKL